MTEENTVKPYSEAIEQNYLEELFRDYTVREADKFTYDWGVPKGHEILEVAE